MQTLLVHWRNPARLVTELGYVRFLASQVLMIGNVFSALVHPLILLTILALVSRWLSGRVETRVDLALLVVDTINVTAAYVFFYVLGSRALSRVERRSGPVLPWIPLYWLMLSAAAWRAVWQLFWRPHLWEKTPHLPAAPVMRSQTAAQSRNAGPEPMTLSSSSPVAAVSRPF